MLHGHPRISVLRGGSPFTMPRMTCVYFSYISNMCTYIYFNYLLTDLINFSGKHVTCDCNDLFDTAFSSGVFFLYTFIPF